MYQDLLSNKDVAAFVEKSGDNILVQLEGTKGTDREKFDELIKKLARENIKLDESLVKYAIAQKTKNEIDEYEYDPLIKFAKDRLKSGLVRL